MYMDGRLALPLISAAAGGPVNTSPAGEARLSALSSSCGGRESVGGSKASPEGGGADARRRTARLVALPSAPALATARVASAERFLFERLCAADDPSSPSAHRCPNFVRLTLLAHCLRWGLRAGIKTCVVGLRVRVRSVDDDGCLQAAICPGGGSHQRRHSSNPCILFWLPALAGF